MAGCACRWLERGEIAPQRGKYWVFLTLSHPPVCRYAQFAG